MALICLYTLTFSAASLHQLLVSSLGCDTLDTKAQTAMFDIRILQLGMSQSQANPETSSWSRSM